MISMKLQEVAVIELGPENPLHASRQAPGEPGRQKMNLPLATPAVARDWTVEGPIFGHDTMWKATEKPSISFSNRNRKASTVTSRPVRPVPPVDRMTSMSSRFSQLRATRRIWPMSSLTIVRPDS